MGDLDTCVAINAPNFNIFDREKRRKHFLEMIPRERMLISEIDSRIVAYATFNPDWFGCTFLKLIVTDPSATPINAFVVTNAWKLIND